MSITRRALGTNDIVSCIAAFGDLPFEGIVLKLVSTVFNEVYDAKGKQCVLVELRSVGNHDRGRVWKLDVGTYSLGKLDPTFFIPGHVEIDLGIADDAPVGVDQVEVRVAMTPEIRVFVTVPPNLMPTGITPSGVWSQSSTDLLEVTTWENEFEIKNRVIVLDADNFPGVDNVAYAYKVRVRRTSPPLAATVSAMRRTYLE
jgi:hypothetical protein